VRIHRSHDFKPILQLGLIQDQDGQVEGERGQDASGGLRGEGP
jgi:hypothetical protein